MVSATVFTNRFFKAGMLSKMSRNPTRVVPAGSRLVMLLPTWTKESTVTHLFATDIRSAPAWLPVSAVVSPLALVA
jgi:hypothetical protein